MLNKSWENTVIILSKICCLIFWSNLQFNYCYFKIYHYWTFSLLSLIYALLEFKICQGPFFFNCKINHKDIIKGITWYILNFWVKISTPPTRDGFTLNKRGYIPIRHKSKIPNPNSTRIWIWICVEFDPTDWLK